MILLAPFIKTLFYMFKPASFLLHIDSDASQASHFTHVDFANCKQSKLYSKKLHFKVWHCYAMTNPICYNYMKITAFFIENM